MGIPELLAHANQWLDKAVESYDEEDYEAVDAACRIAQGHVDLADTAIERRHLDMAEERHRLEVTRRWKALETANDEKPDQATERYSPLPHPF